MPKHSPGIILILLIVGSFCVIAGCGQNSEQHSPTDVGSNILENPTGAEKFVDIVPWPLDYEKNSNIADIDVHRATNICGLQYLQTCSDVYVTAPTNSFEEDIALVKATRPGGQVGLWYVDLGTNTLLTSVTVVSLHPDSLKVVEPSTGLTLTPALIDSAAASTECYDHVMGYAALLNIDTEGKGLGDIWDRIKDKWDDLNNCERFMTVSGVVTCGLATLGGGLPGVACGAGFVLVTLATC